MKIGSAIYARENRLALPLLRAFAVMGICASAATASISLGLPPVEALAATALSGAALAAIIISKRASEVIALRRICLLSMVNVAILILLIAAAW